ncbi:MAG: tryptophan transporter [Coriobacteriales bacterium]|nr:tryptophan transporter [Coriobacteriales bacterium]
MTAQTIAQKRVVAIDEQEGLGVRDLILVAVLLAAGAVLKLTVSSFLTFAGMKPNFMIAMYCLAIILTRPKVYQAAVIGLITGLISQIPMLNATPLVNIASELVGAVVCGLLLVSLTKVAPKTTSMQNVVLPAAITFISTAFSGYTFALVVGSVMNGLPVPVVFATYAVMVLGTATMNAILAAILTPILRKTLKIS